MKTIPCRSATQNTYMYMYVGFTISYMCLETYECVLKELKSREILAVRI